MSDNIRRVVLAFSGGLDTSVILKWLRQTYDCEVVTFTADLGQGEELEPARAKAELMGVRPEHIFIDDLKEEFAADYVFRTRSAPTPSPMAPLARATTRSASSSAIMRWTRTSRSSPRGANGT
jgi:argininosuccinate synthase